MKKVFLSLAAATALTIPATPALALELPTSAGAASQTLNLTATLGYHDDDRWDDYDDDDDWRDRRRYRDRDYRDERRAYRHGYREGRRHEARYDRYGRYVEPRRIHRGDRVWRGRDGYYYCERENGTTGLIIGAAGGALLGREIDRRGDRTLGTVLGAVIGGFLGREIDRGNARCR